MRLPHAHINRADEVLIEFAKTAVAVPVRVQQAILPPLQLQGDVFAPKLGMNMSLVPQHSPDFCRRLHWKQQTLKAIIIHRLDIGPDDRRAPGTEQIVMHRGLFHVGSEGNLTLTERLKIGQTEYFFDPSHGFSLS
jgi:hypothetical protein